MGNRRYPEPEVHEGQEVEKVKSSEIESTERLGSLEQAQNLWLPNHFMITRKENKCGMSGRLPLPLSLFWGKEKERRIGVVWINRFEGQIDLSVEQ